MELIEADWWMALSRIRALQRSKPFRAFILDHCHGGSEVLDATDYVNSVTGVNPVLESDDRWLKMYTKSDTELLVGAERLYSMTSRNAATNGDKNI